MPTFRSPLSPVIPTGAALPGGPVETGTPNAAPTTPPERTRTRSTRRTRTTSAPAPEREGAEDTSSETSPAPRRRRKKTSSKGSEQA